MANLMIVCVVALPTLLAQENQSIREPEYLHVVSYFDPASGSLLRLEKQKPNSSAKVKALGFGGATGSVVFEGPRSPTRFKVGQKIEFLVRLDAPGMEPVSLVNLDVLAVSKEQRAIVVI